MINFQVSQLPLPAALLSLLLIQVSPAAAAPPQLKGEYATTGETACLVSSSGFNSNLQADPTTAFSTSFSVQEVWTFNGDGTGSAEGTGVGITPPPTPGFIPFADSFSFTFNFTYSIASDGTISTNLVPGSYMETILTGPRTGQTATIDTLSLSGLASNNHSTLTLSTHTTTVETRTYSNGNVSHAICHRSRVLIWLGE
jgi:hypothetical protein